MHLLTVHLALARLKCTDVTHNLSAIIQPCNVNRMAVLHKLLIT